MENELEFILVARIFACRFFVEGGELTLRRGVDEVFDEGRRKFRTDVGAFGER